MGPLKIITYNVQGLRDKDKRNKIFTFCRKGNYDIIFLQEVHCSEDVAEDWESEWGGTIIYTYGETNRKGCCIMIAPTVKFETIKNYIDKNGRYIISKCMINDRELTLINSYGPNVDDPTHYTEIMEKAGEMDATSIIWGGS